MLCILCKYSSFCVLLYVTIVKNCNESAVNNLLNFKIWQKLTSVTVRHPQVSHKNSEKLDRIYYFSRKFYDDAKC